MLHDQLKDATADQHARLDALPFFQALQAGTLPAPAIVTLLRGLAIVHAVLERAVTQSADARLAAVASATSPKLPLIVADLERLDVAQTPSITPAIHAALDCGAAILRRAENPLSLLGTLYVLEGSQRGGDVLRKAYAQCLAVPADQLSYWGCYRQDTQARWAQFTLSLNALTCDEGDVAAVTDAAVRAFEWFTRICSALYPYTEQQLKQHVTAVNFEAGDHAMPQAPGEMELALRAGRDAWDRNPYLEMRFGDRGRRFTSSDSCWLVTLIHLPETQGVRSLEWLRSVLASRGISTVILGIYLQCILRLWMDEGFGATASGPGLARFLADREAERASLGYAVPVVERYERRLARCSGLTVPSAATLIASAWVDERAGIVGALSSTLDWFTDQNRFTPEWTDIVHKLLAELDTLTGAVC